MKSLVVMFLCLFSFVLFAETAPAPVVEAVAAVQVPAVQEVQPPPEWVKDLIIGAQSIPVIGPIVVTILQWLGVIVAILTALCAFLLVVLRSLSTVLSMAQLAEWAAKIKAFESSKIVYWLKYFSAFNAQKEEKKA